MKKNVIYVDFRFTHKRIVSKKLHIFCAGTHLARKFFTFFIKGDSNESKDYPFRKIL